MAKKRSDKKPLNPRVTGDGPATGEQYLKLQQKLGLELAEFQALLGTSVKDHYQIAARPDEPLADPGLALHVRLLDEYPELVVPEPAMEDLVRAVKRVKRDYPDTAIPMPATAGAVARMLRVRSMVVLMCSSFSRGIRWIPRGGRTTAYEVGRGRT